MPGIGAAVQTCPVAHDCRAIWDKVEAEKKRVDAIDDAQKRNQQITADYAKLYLAQPDLRWAGVAAFASKQVGCGMSPIYGLGKAGGAVAGPGNQAVFDELYPPLRFYQEAKAAGFSNDEIRACLRTPPGAKLNRAITLGLDQVMSGDPHLGALTMLKHEQQDTLHKAIYSDWWTRRGLQANEATGGTFASEDLVFTHNCQAVGDDPHINFADYPGHIYDFDSRWPFAKDAAGKFGGLTSNPATLPGIEQSLHQLSTGQYPSFELTPPDWSAETP